MSVGDELRQARQQAGLSREQISQDTKIQLAKLEALEGNAFERLPEGIYLDGIVRAYAQSVGLDGDAMVQRVRADRARHPSLVADEMAPGMTEPSPADSGTAMVYSIDSSAYAELDSFPAESEVAYDRGPFESPQVREWDPDVRSDVGAPPAPVKPRRRQFPLVMAVVALLAASTLGGYLYESSRRTADAQGTPGAQGAAGAQGAPGAAGVSGASGDLSGTDRSDVPASSGTASPGEPSRAPADGRAEDALASDALGRRGEQAPPQPPAATASGDAPAPRVTPPAVSAPTRTPAAPTAQRPSSAVPGEPAATGAPIAAGANAGRTAPGAVGARGASAAPGAPSTPSAPAALSAPAAAGAPVAPGAPAAPGAPSAPGAPGAPASPRDLSGVWTLDTRIESSSYRDYEGLQLGYHLELQQDGSRITGTGVKRVENGRRLGSAAQTPILLQGTIEGGRLTLSFIERGLLRSSEGKMILDVNDDGVLRGRFSSSAARSVGIVEARRPAG